jgi:hypothetical protein
MKLRERLLLNMKQMRSRLFKRRLFGTIPSRAMAKPPKGIINFRV